jgi:hypothetical protein
MSHGVQPCEAPARADVLETLEIPRRATPGHAVVPGPSVALEGSREHVVRCLCRRAIARSANRITHETENDLWHAQARYARLGREVKVASQAGITFKPVLLKNAQVLR